MFVWDFEDELWSRFVFELVIWPQEGTLARSTQPSGPLCLWQCFLIMYSCICLHLVFMYFTSKVTVGCTLSVPTRLEKTSQKNTLSFKHCPNYPYPLCHFVTFKNVSQSIWAGDPPIWRKGFCPGKSSPSCQSTPHQPIISGSSSSRIIIITYI